MKTYSRCDPIIPAKACRGDETDTGHMSAEEDGERPSARKRRAPGAGGMDKDTIPFCDRYGEMNKARPTWEDMVIAYSTIPGYASMRDHEKGEETGVCFLKVFLLAAIVPRAQAPGLSRAWWRSS